MKGLAIRIIGRQTVTVIIIKLGPLGYSYLFYPEIVTFPSDFTAKTHHRIGIFSSSFCSGSSVLQPQSPYGWYWFCFAGKEMTRVCLSACDFYCYVYYILHITCRDPLTHTHVCAHTLVSYRSLWGEQKRMGTQCNSALDDVSQANTHTHRHRVRERTCMQR